MKNKLPKEVKDLFKLLAEGLWEDKRHPSPGLLAESALGTATDATMRSVQLHSEGCATCQAATRQTLEILLGLQQKQAHLTMELGVRFPLVSVLRGVRCNDN
jgi:hypothetical protein